MLSIERADIRDASVITEIKIAAYNQEISTYLGRNGGPPGYDSIESQIHIIKNFIAYKIILDSHIIGGLFLILIDSETMRFEDFVIKPIYQGKGYGYRTMELVEENYKNILVWQLSTPIFSKGNQYLYEKFGYIEFSRDDNEIEYIKRITDK
ncbi:Acetyltransferase (GNAT) domain [Anaerocolumna jejuensis DSM 15929]|uniref:Acetyltransferase (GNAT) domain n=1 Tax=Anaerocolumna jejuensis DSM 15929 TaxID=1121322 RepID=A0A1M6MLG4_9FIRM|nr:GNAT family N-acetyltransferase [Anaerocolumna jejuensis]SHJ84307.1 Acetyltransferase (GNAT) domain [Anaerocolumna jejuensis DSM 15929]